MRTYHHGGHTLMRTYHHGGHTLMSKTQHTTMRPRVLSWARSGVVANTQTGYIVASLAWVQFPQQGINSCYGTRFSKTLDLTLTVTLTLMPTTEKCSLMLMIRVFRSRSDRSPQRLLLSLDRALVPVVSSGPCRQRQ